MSSRERISWLLLYDGSCLQGLTVVNVWSDSCTEEKRSYRGMDDSLEGGRGSRGWVRHMSLEWDGV